MDATRRPPRWLFWSFVTVVVGLNLLGMVVGASWPRLLRDHPLLLNILSNRYRFLLAAAPRVPAVPQIIIGILRNLASDPVYWGIGYFYGDQAIEWFRRSMGKADQVIVATERWFHRYGAVIVFITPSPFVCALAGATRMKPRKFWAANLAGTTTIVILLRLLSKVIRSPLEAFLRFSGRYNNWLLILSVAVVLLVVFNAGMGARGQVEGLKDLDEKAGREDARPDS